MVIMSSLKSREPGSLVIFEYVSGGGPVSGSASAGLAGEGLLMAGALFRAFSELDGISASLLLRKDISFPMVEKNGRVIPVNPGEGVDRFISECREREFAVLIAPETDGLSGVLAGMAAGTGVRLLGPDPEAVALSSNKALLMKALETNGVPVPRWCVAREVRAVQDAARETGFPVAAKPLQGTSCEGSAVFCESTEIDLFFAAPGNERAVLLVQPLLRGDAMSLSLVVSRSGRARLLAVNTQAVVIPSEAGSPGGWRKFIYRGGIAGVEDAFFSRRGKWGCPVLEDLAQRVVSSIPGMMGFVGVDIVMTDEGPVVIEVNPRLTTPLAVAGAKAPWNPGKILLDACMSDSLPFDLKVPRVSFRKDDPLDLVF